MMKKQNRKIKTPKLGEFRIIEILQKYLVPMPNNPVPFGDDISALNLDGKKVAVLKTDMLVGKTDVPKGMNLSQAARKAIVMNVSDFASKGVQPTVALVALGLPTGYTEKNIEAIAKGLNTGAQEYGTYIIGGDTNETSDIVISVMLYGIAQKSKLMLRKGANPGDILAVTGFFGKSAAGLRLLLQNCRAPKFLGEKLKKAVFLPKARLTEGLALSACGMVSASIDSSDGLAWSLHELSKLSNVGFLVNNLPVADEVMKFADLNHFDATELALYGGEEYELVLTVKPEGWLTAKKAVETKGGQLLQIGEVTKRDRIILSIEGKESVIEARGWEHFKSFV